VSILSSGRDDLPRRSRSMTTQRERAEEKRLLKLESVEQEVRDGSLVIRAMTPEERKNHPRPQRRRK
jgi:hypothetical protein